MMTHRLCKPRYVDDLTTTKRFGRISEANFQPSSFFCVLDFGGELSAMD